MEKGLKQSNPESMKMSMRTANFVREAITIAEKNKVLSELQDKIKHHMTKKPKYSD